MWDVKACRSCLSTTGKLEKISEPNRRIYNAVTGLDFTQGDGYPKYFCTECIWQIKKILAFRRKSRRAFFVLKEIMIVKKQVATNDVKIVDRVATNLVSPYDTWKPNNTGVYTIMTPDAMETDQYNVNLDTQYDNATSAPSYELKITPKVELELTPSIKPGELTKEEPQIINSSQVITNIKPANYKELDEIEEQENAINETADDFIADDIPNADDEVNIDLDDVFKDLREEVNDESEKESVVDAPSVVPDIKEKPKKNTGFKPMSHLVRVTAQALDTCEIRPLSENEQLLQFQKRMTLEPFKSAPYKCALCLSALENMKKLLEHVAKHNESASYKYPCKICKCRFETKNILHQHASKLHWYEYTCKYCKKKRYTLDGIQKCFNKHGKKREYVDTTENIPFEEFFTKSAQPQEMMKDSMQCYNYTNSQATFVCKTCNLAYKDACQLSKHEKRHYPRADTKLDFVCDNCNTHFIGLPALERHMETWHRYLYTCTRCNEVLRNKRRAVQHQKDHTVHQCRFCPASYRLYNSYEFHMETKHKDKAYTHHCNQCGVSYCFPIRLYRHQLDEHGFISIHDVLPSNPKYKCEPCNAQFVDKKSYQKHLVFWGHEEAENIELACMKCRKLFDTAEEYEEHLKSNCKHVLTFPKKCIYCEALLDTQRDYTNHFMKAHPGMNYLHTGKSMLCELCGKTVARTRIQRHMKLHADGDNEFHVCPYCSTRFLSRKQYVLHVVTIHTRTPYHCALCPSKFRFRVQCRDHILRVHAPVMPYQCKFCSRRFALLEFLSDHAKRVHDAKLDYDKNACQRKLAGRLCLYPMMKLDVSLIQKEVLDKVDLEISDFLTENIQKVTDTTDFYILDSNQEPLIGEPEGAGKRRKRKTDYEEEDVIVNKVTKTQKTPNVVKKSKRNIKEEIEKFRKEMFEETSVYKKEEEEDRKINVKTKINKMKIEESHTPFGEKFEEDSVEYKHNDSVELDYIKVIGENDDVGDTYVVTEDGGEQYVTINGIVYKIEPH